MTDEEMQERITMYQDGLQESYNKRMALEKRVHELEAENADLKRQVTEAICYILSNEGASMIDCRMCFFVSSCERKPQECKPDYEMCLRAVRKYIEQDGE